MKKFLLGEKFTTNCEISFKECVIPKGTIFEIIETNIGWGEHDCCYKVCFNDIDNVESIQIMTYKEINNVKSNVV